MNRIALIGTGGTIAMKEEEGGGGAALKLNAGELADLAGGHQAGIEEFDFSRMPSSSFNSDNAARLADLVEEKRSTHEAVVITHGTDTLEETAFYLEMVLSRGGPPVVLTGAMKAAGEPGYDGASNLKDAIRTACSPLSPGQGVLVVLNQDILSGLYCVKQESQRYSAFGSIQTGKLGAVNGPEVLFYYGSRVHRLLPNKTAGRVSLLKLHYDICAEVFEAVAAQSDSLIVECLGSGRIQPHLIEPLKKASAGKTVVLTARAFSGHLYDAYSYPGSFRSFRGERLIFSPLNALKSCILARLCSGCGKSFEETKSVFEDFFTDGG